MAWHGGRGAERRAERVLTRRRAGCRIRTIVLVAVVVHEQVAVPCGGDDFGLGVAQAELRRAACAGREARREEVEQRFRILLHHVCRLDLLHEELGRALPLFKQEEHFGESKVGRPRLARVVAREEQQVHPSKLLVEQVDVGQLEGLQGSALGGGGGPAVTVGVGAHAPLGLVVGRPGLVVCDQTEDIVHLPFGPEEAHRLHGVREGLRHPTRALEQEERGSRLDRLHDPRVLVGGAGEEHGPDRTEGAQHRAPLRLDVVKDHVVRAACEEARRVEVLPDQFLPRPAVPPQLGAIAVQLVHVANVARVEAAWVQIGVLRFLACMDRPRRQLLLQLLQLPRTRCMGTSCTDQDEQ